MDLQETNGRELLAEERKARRANIVALEETMVALPAEEQRPDVLIPDEYWADGVYGRAMHIPAGVCAVGKIHRFTQITVILKGELSIYSEFGTQRFSAPHVSVTPAGVKRVAFAHEDSTILTFHGNATNERDSAAIEDRLIAKSFDDLDGSKWLSE